MDDIQNFQTNTDYWNCLLKWNQKVYSYRSYSSNEILEICSSKKLISRPIDELGSLLWDWEKTNWELKSLEKHICIEGSTMSEIARWILRDAKYTFFLDWNEIIVAENDLIEWDEYLYQFWQIDYKEKMLQKIIK